MKRQRQLPTSTTPADPRVDRHYPGNRRRRSNLAAARISPIDASHSKPATPNVARGAARKAMCDAADETIAAASIASANFLLLTGSRALAIRSLRFSGNTANHGLLLQATTASTPAVISNATASNRKCSCFNNSVPISGYCKCYRAQPYRTLCVVQMLPSPWYFTHAFVAADN